MTKEQKRYKMIILSDLRIVYNNYNSENKEDRLQAAYHMQQAIEKTIKLKAGIKGLNLWGHDISALIKQCENRNINIQVPNLIKRNANMYTKWEAECRYYPTKVVRRDSIINAYKAVIKWLNSGDTR